MVAKPAPRAKAGKPRRKAAPPPLEVTLQVDVRYGAAPEDVVTIVEQRRIPLLGTLFEQRDVLMRGLFKLMMKAAMATPGVLRRRRPKD